MTDQLPDPDDPILARMRAALDEAAAVDPGTPAPVAAPSRTRWLAAAAAVVLVGAGVAVLTSRGDDSPSTVPETSAESTVPTVPTVSTAPDGSAAPTTSILDVPPGASVYQGNVSGIIDNGDGRGPMLAFGFRESYPPQGGSIPLAGFHWSMVDDELTANGVTWTDTVVGVVGTYDGTTFTLAKPTQPPFPDVEPAPTFERLTLDCGDEKVAPALAAMNALDLVALDVIGASDYRWDGHCGLMLTAMFDTPALRDAIATLGDDVTLQIVFHPVGEEPTTTTVTSGPATTLAPVDPVPPGWMFRLDAPDLGFAAEVVLDAAPPGGWGITGLDPNPLTATAERPATITAYDDPTSRVAMQPMAPWPLGTRLDWHDRVGGNASFVVTRVTKGDRSGTDSTKDGHVLVIDVEGPGDAHWTAYAHRLPQVAGRFFFTGSIRQPNEDVWSTEGWGMNPEGAPMHILAFPAHGALATGYIALIDSEHTDVGESMTDIQVGSTATWQPVDGPAQDLVVVGTARSNTSTAPGDLPDGTVLLVQGRLQSGGWVQLYLALAG